MAKTQKGYILATRSWEDANETVTAEIELRIHYVLHPGCPARLYDDPHPAEDASVELDFVQMETLQNGKHVWVRLTAANDEHNLITWAEEYLADHEDEAFSDAADRAEEAREMAAEARADWGRFWGVEP